MVRLAGTGNVLLLRLQRHGIDAPLDGGEVNLRGSSGCKSDYRKSMAPERGE